MIKKYKKLFESKKIELPDIGDTLLVGKFKNKPVEVKGYGIDDKTGQPVVFVNPGGKKFLFNFRIKKLMK